MIWKHYETDKKFLFYLNNVYGLALLESVSYTHLDVYKRQDLNVTGDWVCITWPEIRWSYKDEDIFNGDEAGIFYKLTPDKTFKFKNEKCIGGKLSKQRVTVFVCANMTGT